MNYAVIETGGKQYKIEKGKVLEVDNLGKEQDEICLFDKVLLCVNGEGVKIGQPYLQDVIVKAKVIKNTKSDKIRVAKFRAKSKYRRAYGFRASITNLLVEDIEVKKKNAVKNYNYIT